MVVWKVPEIAFADCRLPGDRGMTVNKLMEFLLIKLLLYRVN